MSFGGKAAHDALQRLAVSLEPRAFVDRDVRAASLRRLRDDAVGECLRIFQLCATPTLGLEGNLRLVLAPCVRWCVCARLLRAVGRRVDEAVRRDVAAAVAAVAAAAHSARRARRGRRPTMRRTRATGWAERADATSLPRREDDRKDEDGSLATATRPEHRRRVPDPRRGRRARRHRSRGPDARRMERRAGGARRLTGR